MTAVSIRVEQYPERGTSVVTVTVDGRELLCDVAGGGEPEDNTYFRDWSWVVPALELLAKRLGATVSIEEIAK